VIVLAILDIVLIPRIGILGAGIAAVTCELIILVYGLWLISRVGRALPVINVFLLPTLCGIITNLLAEYLFGFHWLLGVLSVIVVFPILVLALRIVSPVEWAIVHELIKPGTYANNKK
jgi:Na+-transporting methylmalonyl-CoA/oxaloacetate decarboxylase gamma subunit